MKNLYPLLILALTTSLLHAQWRIESRNTLAELPHSARLVEVSLSDGTRSARVHAFVFPEAYYRLAVVDNAGKSTSLASAMQAKGAVAGVNGGYFATDFSPVGLLVADGKTLHPYQKARLLSGVFLVHSGKPEILSAEKYADRPLSAQQAIQCGPNLVRDGRAVPGLNALALARRTAVLTDGRGTWALINISSVTLADTGQILAEENLIPGLKVKAALNLDGGSSTALWVNAPQKAFSLPSFATVRNYLAIFPK